VVSKRTNPREKKADIILFGEGLVNQDVKLGYEKFVEQFVNPQQDQHGVYSYQSKIQCP
jgi:hypothetical protein